jgi:hypothetical protein
MTRPGSYRTAIFAIIAIVTSGSIVAAQSPDQQVRCATQAETAFDELTREYTDVLESLTIPYNLTYNNYRAHYSGKINRCLFLVRKTVSLMGNLSDISYLLDASNRNMYALYVETTGKMESCSLIPSVRQTKPCSGRGEFDAFVARYMEH